MHAWIKFWLDAIRWAEPNIFAYERLKNIFIIIRVENSRAPVI